MKKKMLKLKKSQVFQLSFLSTFDYIARIFPLQSKLNFIIKSIIQKKREEKDGPKFDPVWHRHLDLDSQ